MTELTHASEQKQFARCDNCERELGEDDLKPLGEIRHLWDRIDPGEECPAGECRECGALAHLLVPPYRRTKLVLEGLLELDRGEGREGFCNSLLMSMVVQGLRLHPGKYRIVIEKRGDNG
jgi:hypothetical protein